MNPSVQHDDARFLDLLRRWQSGDFSRADEQELRTLTASDDFRREAMEGFMSLPEAAHEERLAALRSRLQQRLKGGRVVLMPQILAAAATLVLLLAALWFFPKWNEKNAESAAQTQVETDKEIPPASSAPAAELPENEYFAQNFPISKSAPSVSGPSKQTDDERGAFGAGAANGEIAVLEEKLLTDDRQPNLAPPPPSPATATAQQSENRILEKAEEAKKDAVTAYRTQENAKAKKSKAPTRAADSTWHETDRKPDMDAARKEARDETPSQSEPAEGWEAFREYLKQNAQLTPEARNKNISGTVRVQFVVNENDEPQNFVIVRSLGYGCDEEAIRLIKAQDWMRGEYPTVVVDVSFVR